MLVLRPDEGAGEVSLKLRLQRLRGRPDISPTWLEEPSEVVSAIVAAMEAFRQQVARVQQADDFTFVGKQRRLRELASATGEEIAKLAETIVHGYPEAIAKLQRQGKKRDEPSDFAKLLTYFRQAEIRATLAAKDGLELRFLAEDLIRTGADDETLSALVDAPVRMLDDATLASARQALQSRNLSEEVKAHVTALSEIVSIIGDGVKEIRRELERYGVPGDDPLAQQAGSASNGDLSA